MLVFRCGHCSEEKEYNRSNINKINLETVDIKGHVVCKDCGEKYKDINKQVQEYADLKRQELEDEFFGATQKVEEKVELDYSGEEKELGNKPSWKKK